MSIPGVITSSSYKASSFQELGLQPFHSSSSCALPFGHVYSEFCMPVSLQLLLPRWLSYLPVSVMQVSASTTTSSDRQLVEIFHTDSKHGHLLASQVAISAGALQVGAPAVQFKRKLFMRRSPGSSLSSPCCAQAEYGLAYWTPVVHFSTFSSTMRMKTITGMSLPGVLVQPPPRIGILTVRTPPHPSLQAVQLPEHEGVGFTGPLSSNFESHSQCHRPLPGSFP